MVWLVLVVTETARTEIYPYLHALSLRDALPCCRPLGIAAAAAGGRLAAGGGLCRRGRPLRALGTARAGTAPDMTTAAFPGRTADTPPPPQPAPGRVAPGVRSEEHTSELQSLMRISYAVFCLKKNTKTNMIYL